MWVLRIEPKSGRTASAFNFGALCPAQEAAVCRKGKLGLAIQKKQTAKFLRVMFIVFQEMKESTADRGLLCQSLCELDELI